MVWRKLQKLIGVMKNEGPRATWGLIKERVSGARPPDEVEIIFRAFKASGWLGTMVDVGAHYGSAMVPFASEGWRVVAFEPDSDNRRHLLSRPEAHLPTVSVDVRAVSNVPASGVDFFRSDQSTGISGLIAFHESHYEADPVDVTTLAAALAEKRLDGVDFLKIDTEGNDLFVLEGFPWDKHSPIAILCEFEDAKTGKVGYGFHEIAQFLVDRGFDVIVSEWYPIVRYGIRHKWRRFAWYPTELVDSAGWGNLIACRDPTLTGRIVDTCVTWSGSEIE